MSTLRDKGNEKRLRENNDNKREKRKRLEILVKNCIIAILTTID